jgi:alginate O-acetyltransferase complex protein AlgI
MVFSSIVFLLYFFPLFFILYYLCPSKLKNALLLGGSIVFYSWGAPRFIFVILGTTILDFAFVQIMDRQTERKWRRLFLILSVSMNVGLLFYFKYANFFIDNINQAIAAAGFKPINLLQVVLPIGISFYTFESVTYVVDVYRKEHKPLTNFLNYQLYIILFPKLIAGPIIRYRDIADQITGRFSTFTYSYALRGFHRFVIGLCKKVMIANTLGAYADKVFDIPANSLSSPVAWVGSICYTMQIYFDFSGYSDMALGIGQMLGFKFPENFNNPYISQSITEFWRRWHMTLGAWMKNYLYIPLGGNKVATKRRLFFNLWVVFLLSGFWHGAAWTFITWGIFHGTFLVLERIGYSNFLKKTGKLPSILLTFLTVNFGWIFFREKSLHDSFHFLGSMFNFNRTVQFPTCNSADLIIFILLALLFSFFASFSPLEKIQNRIYHGTFSFAGNIAFTTISLVLLLCCIALITSSSFNPFIYFRF